MAPRSDFQYSFYNFGFTAFDQRKHRRSNSGGSKSDKEKKKIDPYQVLGVARDASFNAVKIAYRRLALKHHPDKVNVSPEDSPERVEEARTKASSVFAEIASAYEILSDPERRKKHDHVVKYGGDAPPSETEKDKDVYPFSGAKRRKAWDDDNDNMRTGSNQDAASSGLNFTFSTSRTTASDIPGGGRKFVTTTTQYINGRKSTREETLYSDGRRKIRIDTSPNSQAQKEVLNDGIRVQASIPESKEHENKHLSCAAKLWEKINTSVLCPCT